MSVHTYVGARYVPRFTGTYNATQIYEALDVVDNGLGTSYIAKKIVPAGTPLTDTEYWAIYGASSGAIINLQDQINEITNIVVTPEMFGAEGDGTTDDSLAVQNAINNGFIVLFTKSYLIKNVNVTTPHMLIGSGTIYLENSSGASFNKNAFTISADCVIDGLTFEGTIYMGVDVPQLSDTPIKVHDCDNITVRNCTFNGCGFAYGGNSGGIWTYNTAVFRAINVKHVIFDSNIINTTRNEIIVISPDNSYSKHDTLIDFINNKFIDNSYGMSVTLLAEEINISNNYFEGFAYNGSIYNLCCENLLVSGDVFRNCNVQSAYDTREGLLLHATKATFKNIKFNGTLTRFILQGGQNITVDNCDVECSEFCGVDLACKASTEIPNILQNTVTKTHASVTIINNRITITSSANGAIMRVGFGYAGTPDDVITDIGRADSIIVKNNVINFAAAFATGTGKLPVSVGIIARALIMEGNTIINPHATNVLGNTIVSPLYLLVQTGIPSGTIFDAISVNDNTISDADASLATLYVAYSNRSSVLCNYINEYINNTSLTQNVGLTAAQYNTKRSDI